jgi:hypothetical protein
MEVPRALPVGLHLRGSAKDLDLERGWIKAVAGVSILETIGDGNNRIHFSF